MLTRFAASALTAIAVTFTAPAFAADLPGIKVTSTNTVPACVTPGRLMAYTKQRNPKMDPRYDKLAVYYMRYGEQFGIRWDVAYFQMLLETASLVYNGDVDAKQNNFAGIGATGGGVKGESFRDIDQGVRAHLEHVLMYTGEKIDNPIAERTRKIQEWGVLSSWQRSIKGPMNFSQLAKKWAPPARGYSRDVQAIADAFFDGACKKPDPQPELVALARGEKLASAGDNKPADMKSADAKSSEAKSPETKSADAKAKPAPAKAAASSADLVAAVISRTRSSQSEAKPSALGGPVDEPAAAPASSVATDGSPAEPVAATVINAGETAVEPEAAAAVEKTAMVGGEAKKVVPSATPESGKCRVWTASYGGAKAIIIKAVANGVVNYTVLDVNAGKEKREAEAYIAAYAKGGETLQEFSSPTAALDKAFELCPEG